MRVMLRDMEDQTIVVIEADYVFYDPDEQVLCVYRGEMECEVHKVCRANADAAIRELYDTGKVDLTAYQSKIDV